MSAGKNIRRHRRIPYVGPVRISWDDRGQPRFALAKCVDISESGLCIEAPEPVRIGATIQVGAERIKLAGSAVVKHVVRHGSKYSLGVELTQFKLDTSTIAISDNRPPVTVLIENLNKLYQKV
jgi:hypothetical protein